MKHNLFFGGYCDYYSLSLSSSSVSGNEYDLAILYPIVSSFQANTTININDDKDFVSLSFIWIYSWLACLDNNR